jgi:hypothetical protein
MKAPFYRVKPPRLRRICNNVSDFSRRKVFLLLPFGSAVRLFAADDQSVRGKLTRGADGKPVLQTSDGRTVKLTGDADTMGVLGDKRLAGTDFEAIGNLNGDVLAIRPIHVPSLFVWKDGKRLRVTYWCDVCAIRTYTPGLCWCCRDETELDPQAL